MNRLKFQDQTCCFTGHRDVPEYMVKEIDEWLERAIIDLYCNYGVRFFGSGGAMGFDIIAAEAVLRVAEKYPEIKLIMVFPCPDHDAKWPQGWRKRLLHVNTRAAKIVYTSDRYYRGCMHIRNRHLVDYSSYCVAYLQRGDGGTAYTVCYAKEKGRRIVRFPDKISIL